MKRVAVLSVMLLVTHSGIRAQTDTSPHEEHFIEVGGVRLHYLDWGGTGDAMVFLTGYGAPAHVFDDLAPRFTNSFRVVALTRRGQEPSARPSSGYDFDTLTADLKGLLDTLKLQRVHIVAHSFGGAEATQLATRYPDRIASVVYLDAALDAAAGEAVMKEAPIPNPQPAPGTPYAQVLLWWTVYTPDFSKVRCPALAFYVLQNSPPIPRDADSALRQRADTYWRTRWLPMVKRTIDKFRREAPAGRVVILENASHYLFRDREADVLREMNGFYSSMQR